MSACNAGFYILRNLLLGSKEQYRTPDKRLDEHPDTIQLGQFYTNAHIKIIPKLRIYSA